MNKSKRTGLNWRRLILPTLIGWVGAVAYWIAVGPEETPDARADVAIVLGAAVSGGEPSPVFRERIAHGVDLYEAGRVERLLFTGGRGEGTSIAESEAARVMAVAEGIPALIGPQTTVLTAMNGVPWWFFDGFGKSCEGLQLKSVDPTGSVASAIPASQVVGGVVHGSFSLNAPGFARHGFGKKIIIGKPDGTTADPLTELAKLLGDAGMEIDISDNIQREIWFKL